MSDDNTSGVNPGAERHVATFVNAMIDARARGKEISEEMKDLKAEAKANGVDLKAAMKVVAFKEKPKTLDQHEEQSFVLESYLSLVGLRN